MSDIELGLDLVTRIGVNLILAAALGLLGAVLLLGVIAVIHVGDRLYRRGRDRAALAWFFGVAVVALALVLTVAGA